MAELDISKKAFVSLSFVTTLLIYQQPAVIDVLSSDKDIEKRIIIADTNGQ